MLKLGLASSGKHSPFSVAVPRATLERASGRYERNKELAQLGIVIPPMTRVDQTFYAISDIDETKPGSKFSNCINCGGVDWKHEQVKMADGTVATRKGGTPKTMTAIDMALLANPGKTKKSIYSRGVTSFANEPIHHAMELQRSAVTFKMQNGASYMDAHKQVGQSNGINMGALFGLEDDPDCVKKIADICFNPAKGIEFFGENMQQE